MNYKTTIELEENYKNLLSEPAIAEPKLESVNKYVDLLSDIGFKHVFGREANKEILIVFLNEFLPDRKISDIEHIRNDRRRTRTILCTNVNRKRPSKSNENRHPYWARRRHG